MEGKGCKALIVAILILTVTSPFRLIVKALSRLRHNHPKGHPMTNKIQVTRNGEHVIGHVTEEMLDDMRKAQHSHETEPTDKRGRYCVNGTWYYDYGTCPVCKESNRATRLVDQVGSSVCEVETECTSCGHKDYWAYGWYESLTNER